MERILDLINEKQKVLDTEYKHPHYRTSNELAELYKLEGEIKALKVVLDILKNEN